MESYTSDSCDSDSREQKILDLSERTLEDEAAEKALDEAAQGEKYKQPCETECPYETVLLHVNRLSTVPLAMAAFSKLRHLDLSSNSLTTLPDVLSWCPLTSLIVKNNRLTNESLPKAFCPKATALKELNLSGNRLTTFPEQLLDLASLKYLYLGGNQIANVPRDIWKNIR